MRLNWISKMSFSTVNNGKYSHLLNIPKGAEVATIGEGCFWGVEHIFRKYFGNGKGLIDARVGFSGGNKENPSYKLVCTGTTNHAEVVQLSFDPKILSYETIIDFFFRTHDPTTVNSQGPDIGTQYKSVIFYDTDEQKKIANDIKNKFQKEWYPNKPIATQILPLEKFFDAENYHQQYLEKNPSGYECPTHFLRTKPM